MKSDSSLLKTMRERHLQTHPNCTYGDQPHYMPPSMGDPGFFLCDRPQFADAPVEPGPAPTGPAAVTPVEPPPYQCGGCGEKSYTQGGSQEHVERCHRGQKASS